MAVNAWGQIFAWGSNEHGQLGKLSSLTSIDAHIYEHSLDLYDCHPLSFTGLGAIDDTCYPTLVKSLASEKIVQIAAGATHSMALSISEFGST